MYTHSNKKKRDDFYMKKPLLEDYKKDEDYDWYGYCKALNEYIMEIEYE